MNTLAFVWNGKRLTITIDGVVHHVEPSFVHFQELVKALNEKKSSNEVLAILDKKRDIKQEVAKANSSVVYENGQVLLDGKPLRNLVVDKIHRLVSLNLPIQPVLNFLAKLEDNPSFNSKEQLYNFLEAHELTLTEDGDFLAYKSIRGDWMDKYSGRIYNGVGQVIRMKRSEVNDDPNVHCHKGLHCGAWAYSGFGGWYNSPDDRVICVKVNPRDAVSCPKDHSAQKLRVCEYLVLCEIKDKPAIELYKDDGTPYEYEVPKFEYNPSFEEDEDDWEDSDIYDYDEDDYDESDYIDDDYDLDMPEAI